MTPGSITPELDSHKAHNVAILPAWPYANGPRHLGHGASLVPADTMARYHRGIGNEVIMVSGTDEYGTPNVIAAEKAGVPTADYVDSMNQVIRDDFQALGMSFDWFSRTTTEQHATTAQELFEKLADSGYLEKGSMLGSFDSETGQALPDRYVEGGCPSCGAGTRGDQCENCSTILDPVDLIDPHSSLTKNAVNFIETEHWFLMLDKLAPQLEEWVSGHENLRPNAKTASLNQIDELRPRAITRDMEWGVPLPEGYELDGENEKVLYVWFEAVTGYLSASIEWANAQGEPDKWKEWWVNQDAEHVYAMGKDNVPFHTIIWPAILTGASEGQTDKLHLPDRIASTEYLTLGDQKFSSSHGNTLYIRDLIDVVGPDPLRFYLLNNGPETRDKVFNPEELVTINNEELLSKWGNLVQRVLKLTVANFDGEVPQVDPDELPQSSRELFDKIATTYDEAGEALRETRFAIASRRVLQLCVEANRYINEFEPWKTAKTDPATTANTLYTSLVAVDNLSRLFTPFMPSTSQKVHQLLGYSDNIAGTIVQQTTPEGLTVLSGDYQSTKGSWSYTQIPVGQPVELGTHLFKKLDAKAIVQQLADAK